MFKKHLHILVFCLIGHCCWASDESAKVALTMKWASFAGGDSYTDQIYSLATDSSTNLYFGGVLGAGGFLIPDGSSVTQLNLLSLTPGSDSAYVAKASMDGSLLWVSSLDYGCGGVTYGLLSTNNTVYVVGAVTRENLDLDRWTEASLTCINGADGTLNSGWPKNLSDDSGSCC
jgi:hypothetical protein